MGTRQRGRGGLGRRGAGGLDDATGTGRASAGAALLDAYEDFALKLVDRLIEVDPAEGERVRDWAAAMLDTKWQPGALLALLDDTQLMRRLMAHLLRITAATRR